MGAESTPLWGRGLGSLSVLLWFGGLWELGRVPSRLGGCVIGSSGARPRGRMVMSCCIDFRSVCLILACFKNRFRFIRNKITQCVLNKLGLIGEGSCGLINPIFLTSTLLSDCNPVT